MQIEKAQKDDHIILSKITYLGKAFWGYDKELLDKWKDDLTITPEYISINETFKLISAGQIIGYYSFLELENNIIKLDFLFILPEYIGSGIGKLLMNDFINNVINRNAHKIILDADPNAEKFYSKFGFKTYNYLESSVINRFLPQMELVLI